MESKSIKNGSIEFPGANGCSELKVRITMIQRRFYDSEHSLNDLVHAKLARNPYIAGRNLQVEVHQDAVVLKGVVSSYYQKQLAQEAVRVIEGIKQVRNELEVISQ